MKILMIGIAFSVGFIANEWMRKEQVRTVVVTSPPQTVTRWDTLIQKDTLIWHDTVREDCRELVGYQRKWREAKRDLDKWNRSYQRLRREYPNAATLFSEILINGK